MLLDVLTKGDSTIISKIELLSQSMGELQKKVTLSPWIPFLTALLGGILVMIGQYIERKSKKEQERVKELNEIAAICELSLFKLKSLVKDLSAAKNLSNFWYYGHCREENNVPRNDERSKKYYDSTFEYAAAAASHKTKISDIIADYYSSVVKFKNQDKNNIDVDVLRNLLNNLVFDDAPEIDPNLSLDDAREAYNENHSRLSNTYLDLIGPLDAINLQMNTICKTQNKSE